MVIALVWVHYETLRVLLVLLMSWRLFSRSHFDGHTAGATADHDDDGGGRRQAMKVAVESMKKKVKKVSPPPPFLLHWVGPLSPLHVSALPGCCRCRVRSAVVLFCDGLKDNQCRGDVVAFAMPNAANVYVCRSCLRGREGFVPCRPHTRDGNDTYRYNPSTSSLGSCYNGC